MVVIFVTYLVSRLLLKLWELYDQLTGLKQVTAEQYGAHVLLRNPSVKPCCAPDAKH